MTVAGTIRYQEPMSKHTSWRVGGKADVYFEPKDLDDLLVFLRSDPPQQTLFWFGLGSNILVRDGGIRGTVIAQSGQLNRLEYLGNHRIYAEVGVSCAKLSRFAKKQGLGGLAFLSGIPGSVGGALAMNAGAFGGETWPQVASVQTVDAQGNLYTRSPDEFDIAYRHVAPKQVREEWFVAAEFALTEQTEENEIKALLQKRNQSQPIGLPSCGSVFKNPPGNHAAKLIEACGLKGQCIGKACVSDKHANFIINTGGALASEIEALITHVQKSVEKHHGITLETEVRIVGEATCN